MAANGNAEGFQSDTMGMGLGNSIQNWNQDKIKADLLGLQWAAVQGKYYSGQRNVKYVTRGSVIVCNSGNQFGKIDLAVDHGVEAKGSRLPILTVEDFKSQNIPKFGICRIKLAQSIDSKLHVCVPQIANQWTQTTTTTASGSAALLQADAFAICNTGGIIYTKKVNKTPQESLMAVLKEQYGFDERTTKIILDLYQKIQSKYPDEKQIKRDWRFTRLLGGFSYGLDGEGGSGSEFQWNETAGDATIVGQETQGARGYSGTIFVDLPVKKYMMQVLEVNEEDYEYLKYKIRIQNFLVGQDAKDIKYNQDDVNSGQKEINSIWVGSMNKAMKKTLGDIEFVQNWNQQCDDMCDMTDFAHQQITTASILATEVNANGLIVNIGLGGDRRREQMAGWLGDATIYGQNGEPPSFGNDDYKADLDAENLGYMVRNEKYSYIKAIEDYYNRRLLEDNRAEQFLENNLFEDVKRQIYDGIVLVEYADKMSYAFTHEEEMQLYESFKYENESSWLMILKDLAPDTYVFFRSLEAKMPEMGDFK